MAGAGAMGGMGTITDVNVAIVVWGGPLARQITALGTIMQKHNNLNGRITQ